MRILVAVKQVGTLDPDFELDDDGSIDPDYLYDELNDWDEGAVLAALRLRDDSGGELTVVTVGGPASEPVLVEGLARGADRAVRVDDTRPDTDGPLRTARALAALITRDRPDLVVCGVQSSDFGHAATGIAAAGAARLRHVAAATSIAPDGPASLVVVRTLEDGIAERVRVPLPALVTLQADGPKPERTTLRALAEAQATPIEVLSLEDLGSPWLGHDDALAVVLERPPQRPGATFLTGDAMSLAAQIVTILGERTTSAQGASA